MQRRFNISAQEKALNPDGTFTRFWYNAWDRINQWSTEEQGITELTGDVLAGPGSGTQAAVLSATGVSPGTYGDASNIAQFTVNNKGRLTFAANIPIDSTRYMPIFVGGLAMSVGGTLMVTHWEPPTS